jgi:hypothetical protein
VGSIFGLDLDDDPDECDFIARVAEVSEREFPTTEWFSDLLGAGVESGTGEEQHFPCGAAIAAA